MSDARQYGDTGKREHGYPSLSDDLAKAARSFARAARAFQRLTHPVHRAVHHMSIGMAPDDTEAVRRRRQRARCRICFPHANPRPLAIDGHDYSRRRSNRGRHRR